ncbi:MAG: glycosyltransferase family 39 protein [Rhizomicrobium sp.]|nr:glycosyltransferase family 39 protein [Rhizomicrobium sp.]
MVSIAATAQSFAHGWKAHWHLLRTDKSPEGVLRRSLVLLAVVTAVTAWFSETFFFPDEHFQILEFMAMKLGITSPAELPWEFGARARPFFQPFLYFLIAKPLTFLGLRDAFDLMFVLRLVTGAFSLLALAVFARFLLAELTRQDERFAFAKMLPFMGFLPYLFVRTASETAAAAFFALALVLAVRGVRASSWRWLAWAGLLCGAAFESRYQTAFLVLGLLAWLAFEARARWTELLSFCAAGLTVVALSLLIDRWGYGVWCFPPWNYIDVNIIQGVASKVFGTAPWFAYFYLEPGTLFAPITVLLMIAMVVACLRNPRHVITWVTVPFFLIHCLIAHKEERFLFPLAILAISYPVLAFAPGRPFALFDGVWAWRRSIAAKVVGWSAVAAMVFLAVYPFGIRPHMRMAKYLYRHFPSGFHAYSFDAEGFENYPMLRRKPYRIDIVIDREDLQAQLGKGPIYLLSDTPSLPAMAQGLRAQMLYSDFIFAGSPGAAAWATKVMCGYADLKRTTPIHPPRLKFLTLYKLEAGQGPVATTPCTPVWN